MCITGAFCGGQGSAWMHCLKPVVFQSLFYGIRPHGEAFPPPMTQFPSHRFSYLEPLLIGTNHCTPGECPTRPAWHALMYSSRHHSLSKLLGFLRYSFFLLPSPRCQDLHLLLKISYPMTGFAVTRRSVLFTSNVSGFNVLADQFIWKKNDSKSSHYLTATHFHFYSPPYLSHFSSTHFPLWMVRLDGNTLCIQTLPMISLSNPRIKPLSPVTADLFL